MRSKKNRDINVFSTSAIDLFASAMGVFVLIVVITMPFYQNTSQIDPQSVVARAEFERIVKELREVEQKTKILIQEKERIQKEYLNVQSDLKKLEQRSSLPPKDDAKILEEKLEELKRSNESLKIEQKVKDDKLVLLEQRLRELQANQSQENIEIKNQLAMLEQLKKKSEDLEKTVDTQKQEIQKLQQEISQMVEAQRKSFLVVIVKWTTTKHDLDLRVIDPRGRAFDFKNKSHKGHEGLFSLDSRSGPGAEIFQSAQAETGEYRITYDFYNSYGNNEPLVAFGTILTSKGSFEIPPVTMDFKTTRNKKIAFQLLDGGQVELK